MLSGSLDGELLLGREAEIGVLATALDQVADKGSALVLSGAPGIGKSRLLEETAAAAQDRGMAVLRTTGVESEAQIPFSGLHQLLRPVRHRASDLLPGQRAALDAAFGLSDGAPPELFVIAMAVLDLLSEVAAEAPLLVIAEDAHWLDRSSAEVLAFVARRLESDQILLLAAIRNGYPTPLGDTGLSELHLEALDPTTATSLLALTAQDLPQPARERILDEAAGNPLALIELPLAGADLRPDGQVPALVPLTERLERTFAARVSDQPPKTRLLLLAAALNDTDDLGEALRAGSLLAGEELDLDQLEPANAAAIVEVDLRTIRFRHPLVRSAVNQNATLSERRRAHEALAEVLAGEPDRRVWHRAALVSGEHEEVAVELEEAAARARRRGAIRVAVNALRRAGELSGKETGSRRLLAAASLAFELGRPDLVVPLVHEVGSFELGPLETARITWLEEMATTLPLGEEARFGELIAAAERAGEAGDQELRIDLLWLVASRSWWVDPGPEARRMLIEAADRLGGADAEDPRVFSIHAYADPYAHAPEVLARLRAAAGGRRDTEMARHFGPAALVVGAFDLGVDFLAAAIDGLRDEGRLGHLPRMLTLYSSMAARLGDWDAAIPAAAEARALAEELGEAHWEAAANTVISLIAGMRGDEAAAEQIAAEAEQVASADGANITVAFAQFGPVLAHLGAGRHADALAAAGRLFEPTDPAYHPFICSWLIADLAEAALHLGRIEEGRERVAQVAAATGDDPGTWLAIGLGHAQALLADDDEAEERFERAMALDLARWPFQRARIELAYGQWLRRRRRIADSRSPLRNARDAFDRLGCEAWGNRARRELRASGESSRRRVPEARDQLTAQELQIAQLAAEGLSNREIGQKLFVSHRTVGTHLYRIFPKLGISARGELASALSGAPAPSPE
jgi:DNA-binding CsgD family transcriptional regulator